jgi:hypothetical protein
MSDMGKIIINNSRFEMSKTKTMRIKYDDAFVIEQAVRELAADLQKEITVSDFLTELSKDVQKAKERYKDKITKTSLK